MAKCEHHEICGRDADKNMEDGLCILHSENLGKNRDAFIRALEERIKPERYNFSGFVFPWLIRFQGVTFESDFTVNDPYVTVGFKW